MRTSESGSIYPYIYIGLGEPSLLGWQLIFPGATEACSLACHFALQWEMFALKLPFSGYRSI